MADASMEQRLRVDGHLFRSHQGETHWVQVEELPGRMMHPRMERDAFLDRIFDLEAQKADLHRWKGEAIEVLKRWDALADDIEAELGALRSDAVAAHIKRLEAELERTRQAWVDGAEPECDDVCMVACKGPCGGAA